MKLNKLLNDSIQILEQAEQQNKIDRKLTSLFHNVPFYCEWAGNITDCNSNNSKCFNHIVGLPIKDGREYPLFDYEHDIIKQLEDQSNPNDIKHKHIWIKKSTGLGISELILRYICYRCLVNDDWTNSMVCLVSAPRIESAVLLAERLSAKHASECNEAANYRILA